MAKKDIEENPGKVNRYLTEQSLSYSAMTQNPEFNINSILARKITVYLVVMFISQNLFAAEKKYASPFDFLKTDSDISIRYGIWHPKGEKRSGTVILLGGRTEFMEKYAETIQKLNQRGYSIYSFDWRGQGLSTRMLANRHKGFVRSYGDYLRDLDIFINIIVEPEAVSPLIILAHSMGGHIALRYIHDHPGKIDRAVLVAPMIDIMANSFFRYLVRGFTRISVKAGLGHVYTLGSGNYSPAKVKFEGNRLTSDPERFMDEQRAIADNPKLALAGVTYGWLSATFESVDILTQPGYVGTIKTPVLIVSAGSDRIVSVEAQKAICSAIPNCKFTLIKDSMHEILKETDSIQAIFWDEFDRFTRREQSP